MDASAYGFRASRGGDPLTLNASQRVAKRVSQPRASYSFLSRDRSRAMSLTSPVNAHIGFHWKWEARLLQEHGGPAVVPLPSAFEKLLRMTVTWNTDHHVRVHLTALRMAQGNRHAEVEATLSIKRLDKYYDSDSSEMLKWTSNELNKVDQPAEQVSTRSFSIRSGSVLEFDLRLTEPSSNTHIPRCFALATVPTELAVTAKAANTMSGKTGYVSRLNGDLSRGLNVDGLLRVVRRSDESKAFLGRLLLVSGHRQGDLGVLVNADGRLAVFSNVARRIWVFRGC